MTWDGVKREVADILASVAALVVLMLIARAVAWLIGMDPAEALALMALAFALDKSRATPPA